MKKMWIVLKTEFIKTVTRRSFILTLILVPLVPALILGGISLLGNDQVENGIGEIFQPAQETQLSEGYVDRAAIISELPEWIDENRLIRFESETAAREAAQAGLITGYYVIQPDYLETGSIQYILNEFNPLSAFDSKTIIDQVINFNLLGTDPQRFALFQLPTITQGINLSPDEEVRDMTSPIAFFLPYGVTMLFYILIISSASLIMNSVAKEKENRVMEVLLSSIRPNQLLTGKILGLGLVGLLQLVVWMGSALVLLRMGGTTLNIPPDLQLSPSLLFWGITFFILGYLIYATIMAGVGALVPNVKEATQATFIIILPLLVPLMLVGVLINQPNATIAVVLSLIPFTAPNTIMTRLASGPVPLWQLILSIGIMILTILLLIHAVSGMFRAQVLLTGKKFNFAVFVKALLGKRLDQSQPAEG